MKRLIATAVACLAVASSSLLAQSFDLAAYQRRLVIPVAGSLRAADGSKFKTSLRLTLPPRTNDNTTLSGRIVFHPAGRTISDSDPSVAYSLQYKPLLAESLYFDDVVGEMGQSGLGTIDIIPDGEQTSVPVVEARIVNDRAGSINGDNVAVLTGAQALTTSPGRIYEFPVFDQARARVNVGIRTYGDRPVLIDVDIFGYAGTVHHVQHFVQPNLFQQMSLEQFAGQPVADGETVRALVHAPGTATSNALIYYTITENSTNDPTVIAPAPSTRTISLAP